MISPRKLAEMMASSVMERSMTSAFREEGDPSWLRYSDGLPVMVSDGTEEASTGSWMRIPILTAGCQDGNPHPPSACYPQNHRSEPCTKFQHFPSRSGT